MQPLSPRFLAPDLAICPLLNGLWQVSGAHGTIAPAAAIASMADYWTAGLTTFDMADHYGPAEEFIGQLRQTLRQRHGEAALDHLQAFTKWVPRPGPMTRAIVEHHINISRRRMQTATLDLLQFHWWDYSDDRYLEALQHLTDLKTAGALRHLALTNFDTAHLQQILGHGIPIVSNQVQFSLIDQRPLAQMVPYCQTQGVHLLAYGTLCGGLLSERYLAQPEPSPAALDTASLRKYKQMVDAWGGWALFQTLLTTLQAIAQKHQVTIPAVAVRAILDQPMVAGAIIGVRFGRSAHCEENIASLTLTLDAADRAAIQAVLAQSRDLLTVIGDCGDEYRRR